MTKYNIKQVQKLLNNKFEKAYIYSLSSTVDSNLKYQILDLNSFDSNAQFYSLEQIVEFYDL